MYSMLLYSAVEMLTDERKEHCRFVESVVLDERHLLLLATVVQSDHCAESLIDSTLLRVMSQALYEFCLKELQASPRGAATSPSHPLRQSKGHGL